MATTSSTCMASFTTKGSPYPTPIKHLLYARKNLLTFGLSYPILFLPIEVSHFNRRGQLGAPQAWPRDVSRL